VSGLPSDILPRTSWHLSIYSCVMELFNVAETTWFGKCHRLQHLAPPPCVRSTKSTPRRATYLFRRRTTFIADNYRKPPCHGKTVFRPTILTRFTYHSSQLETPSLLGECKRAPEVPGRRNVVTNQGQIFGMILFIRPPARLECCPQHDCSTI
jgi:hypothetical protein